MKRVQVDHQPPAVKKFLEELRITPEGVELRLGGETIGKFFPPAELTDAEKEQVLARGRDLVARARRRNEGVPARILEREVHQAVNEVRRRRS
ncbi:MAG: hypothetical protein U0793_06550 [Gemmataceae bacterium]